MFRATSILPPVLALAVVLWDLGYKLSLYHAPQNQVGRTDVAKLWTGPQKVSLRGKDVRDQSWPTVQFNIRAFANDHPSHANVQLIPPFVRVRNGQHSRLGMLRSPPLRFLWQVRQASAR